MLSTFSRFLTPFSAPPWSRILLSLVTQFRAASPSSILFFPSCFKGPPFFSLRLLSFYSVVSNEEISSLLMFYSQLISLNNALVSFAQTPVCLAQVGWMFCIGLMININSSFWFFMETLRFWLLEFAALSESCYFIRLCIVSYFYSSLAIKLTYLSRSTREIFNIFFSIIVYSIFNVFSTFLYSVFIFFKHLHISIFRAGQVSFVPPPSNEVRVVTRVPFDYSRHLVLSLCTFIISDLILDFKKSNFAESSIKIVKSSSSLAIVAPKLRVIQIAKNFMLLTFVGESHFSVKPTFNIQRSILSLTFLLSL